VQPLIPENAPEIPKDFDQEMTRSPPQTNGTFPLTIPSESRSTVKQQQQLVKQVALLYAAHVVVITAHC
jgi:transcription initiation factor TFIID subunit 6